MTVRSVAGLALVFLFLSSLLAQPSKPSGDDKKPGKDDKTEAPKPPPAPPFKDGRLDDGDKDKLTQPELNDLRKLVFGVLDAPTGTRATAVMEKAARWYIYRLTSPELQEGREGSMSQHMEEILGGPSGIPPGRLYSSISKSDADREELERRDRQWTAVEKFRPIAIAHVEKVMELNPPIARINALRILHRLAELHLKNNGNEEVADVFIRTIENPHEHDAVRLWAFHGLGALFNLQSTPVAADKIKVKDPRRMDRALLAICNWLDARCKMDAGIVSQMSEGEKNGISFVRRAAVRALGNSRRPLVKDDKGTREGPIAQLLVKLSSIEQNSPVSPSTNWSESVEAVLALCKLQPRLSPSYQPDFAAHHVARFVAALGTQANDDVTRENPLWRSYGLQLRTAIDDFARDVPPVKSATTQMGNAIDNLIDSSKHKQAAAELFNWANAPANVPKAKDIYAAPTP